MEPTRQGRVITFYSYKGGTGRTMALVNCACLLARGAVAEIGRAPEAKRVLVIDWDLEAPGLERYLAPWQASGSRGVRSRPPHGVIGLFELLDRRTKNWIAADIDAHFADTPALLDSLRLVTDFCMPVEGIPGLSFLPAGPTATEGYAARVSSFDWLGFYGRTVGLFPALAHYMGQHFDYVFVDARTGVTDISGICTTLLPEALVVVFTPNAQSLTGLVDLVERATHYRRASDDPRPLTVFPLPARIENARPDLRSIWRQGGSLPDGAGTIQGYQPRFEKLLNRVFGLEACDLTAYFNAVEVHHVPDYAYGEPVPVETEREEGTLSLRRIYMAFCERVISLDGPWEEPEAVAAQRALDWRVDSAASRMASDSEAAEKDALVALDAHQHDERLQSTELAHLLTSLAERRLGTNDVTWAKAAEAIAAGAVEVAERSAGPAHPQTINARVMLARAQLRQERHAEALATINVALDATRQLLGGDHPEVAERLDLKAEILFRLSRYGEGLGGRREAHTIRTSELGVTDSVTMLSAQRLDEAAAEVTKLIEQGKLSRREKRTAQAELEQVARMLSAGAVQIIGKNSVVGRYVQDSIHRSGEDPTLWLERFVQDTYVRWESLPLERLVTSAADRGAGVKPPALFTPLDVWALPGEELRATRDGETRGEMVGPTIGELQREPAIAAMARHKRLVLIGGPGSGKSTLARFLVVCNAGELLGRPINLTTLNAAVIEGGDDQDRLRADRSSHATGPMWPHQARLPIYVELRYFASDESEAARAFPAVGEKGEYTHFQRFLRHHVEDDAALRPANNAIVGALEHRWGAGVLIVLDGLDEVAEADARRVRLKQVVESLADTYPEAMILLTSRSYAYQAGAKWRLSERFQVSELAPYNDRQIAFYVGRWYAEAKAHRPEQFPGRTAEEWSGRLVASVRQERHLRDLATRPLLLAMMTLLHDARGGRLPPGGRTALYNETTDLLMQRWIEGRGQQPLTQGLGLTYEQIREVLERLAFHVHATSADVTSPAAADIPVERLFKEISAVRAKGDLRVDFNQVRRRLQQRAGILVADSHDLYRFPHRSFQEFLAACGLARRPADLKMPASAGEPADRLEGWTFPENVTALVRTEPDRWREVAQLAGGWSVMLGTDDAWALIDLLTDGEPPATPNDPQWWSALVAGRVLGEHSQLKPRRPGHQVALQRAREWMGAALGSGALPPMYRAVIGRDLAARDDPRLGVGCDAAGVPAIAWFPLPAGEFVMGSDKQVDDLALNDQMPQHTARVPQPLQFGRYPITVAQFEPFVVGDGYPNRAYWSDAGWQWKQDSNRTEPRYWQDPAWHVANHPVIGMTWYEADAYCRWLSERLGHLVRLPTETEWEYAARGPDGRIWPWGNAFDPDLCNSNESGIGCTTAVGMFPIGGGPWGPGCPLDMSGNVWEWCSTKWRDGYGGAEDNELEGPGGRVLRGGAFNSHRSAVRCAYRNWLDPDCGNNVAGFRVVAPI